MVVSYEPNSVIDLLDTLKVVEWNEVNKVRTATNPKLLSLKRLKKKDYVFVSS